MVLWRAFLGATSDFRKSHARPGDLLDGKDRRGLPDFTTVAVDDSENLRWNTSGARRLFSQLRVLLLAVEEPLVDLLPAEASGAFRLVALPRIQLAARHFVQAR